MEIDERFGGHIALQKLWDVHSKLRLLSDGEAGHLAFCDRCLATLVICRISKSLEEADMRLRDHVAVD